MATITGITAPANAVDGQTIKVTPVISNPDRVLTLKGSDDSGQSVTVTVNIHDNLTLTTDTTKKGQKGFIVLEASMSDGSPVTPTVDPDGIEFDIPVP